MAEVPTLIPLVLKIPLSPVAEVLSPQPLYPLQEKGSLHQRIPVEIWERTVTVKLSHLGCDQEHLPTRHRSQKPGGALTPAPSPWHQFLKVISCGDWPHQKNRGPSRTRSPLLRQS